MSIFEIEGWRGRETERERDCAPATANTKKEIIQNPGGDNHIALQHSAVLRKSVSVNAVDAEYYVNNYY